MGGVVSGTSAAAASAPHTERDRVFIGNQRGQLQKEPAQECLFSRQMNSDRRGEGAKRGGGGGGGGA